MLNYLKSEIHRIVTSKNIYIFTFGIALFALSMNLLLFVSNQTIPDFPYGTARFSLSNIIMLIYLITICAGILTTLLYADDQKNGTLKNAVVTGISRAQLFVAKCLISCFFGLLSMIVILLVYLVSTVLLLDGPVTEAITVFALGIIAIFPATVAAVVLNIALFHLIKSANWAQITWILVFFAVPMFLFSLGAYYEPVRAVAGWLPMNIFFFEIDVTMSEFNCVWQTGLGMAKCLVSGGVSLVLSICFGLWCTQKMEL